MTKKELLEQLEELRSQIDTLNTKIEELDENTEPDTRGQNQWKADHSIIYLSIEK